MPPESAKAETPLPAFLGAFGSSLVWTLDVVTGRARGAARGRGRGFHPELVWAVGFLPRGFCNGTSLNSTLFHMYFLSLPKPLLGG